MRNTLLLSHITVMTLLFTFFVVGCDSFSLPFIGDQSNEHPETVEATETGIDEPVAQEPLVPLTDPNTQVAYNPINPQHVEKLLRQEYDTIPTSQADSGDDSGKPLVAESPESDTQRIEPVEVTAPEVENTTAPLVMVEMPALKDSLLSDEMISLNLGQVDIIQVIELVSDATGINFVWDDTISGTISVNSPTEIRMDQLYSFLESLLELKGYTAVASGDLVKIVRRSQAVRENLQVRIGADPETIPLTDTLITQIIPLRYADVAEVAAIIKPRLSDGAQMDANSRTQKIIITDSSANIHHITRIIAQLDLPDAQAQTEVIPLKYASAQVLSKQITQILQQQSTNPAARGNPANRPETTQKIQANDRINSLIVTAKPKDLHLIRDMVARLDIEKPNGFDKVHHVRLKNASAEDMAESLAQALLNLTGIVSEGVLQPKVTPDLATNSLIIVATQQDFSVIQRIIDQLDTEQEMVLVEVKIVEVSQEGLLEIGIDWATLDQAVADSIRGFAVTNFGPRSDYINGTVSGVSVGAFKDIGGEVTIGSVLQALEENQGINILSSPSVTTRNHQQATFIAGDNVPFVGQSRITEEADPSTPTVIQTFDYRDVGVILKVTPHISQNDTIIIDIDSEFTNIIEGRPGQSVDTPTTSKRSVITSLLLKNGTTTYLSGLTRDDRVAIRAQIPLLGDIPLIGELFKWRREQVQKTNLILSITPYIIKTETQMAELVEEKNDTIDIANDEVQSNW